MNDYVKIKSLWNHFKDKLMTDVCYFQHLEMIILKMKKGKKTPVFDAVVIQCIYFLLLALHAVVFNGGGRYFD